MMRLRSLGVCALVLAACAAQTDKRSGAVEGDEQAIRQWFDRWIEATKEGDLPLARSLIADDAVFLVPGAGRMDKERFAAAATGSDPSIEFRLAASIREISVLGDHAWLWTEMTLDMTDKTTKTRSRMAGHALSILKRQGQGWVVFRDANTMAPVKLD